MKQQIDVFDYAGQFCAAMKKGILLTTQAEGKLNTMTIGWGTIGIEWGKPIFIAFVRESRHTRSMLDQCGEFTVNAPYGDFDPRVLGYCGTKSGRDTDKFSDLGLHPEEPVCISVPGIREFPLTLECKVLYKQAQDLSAIPQDILDKYYPQDIPGTESGRNRDFHYAYYAEIVNAYLITD